MRPYLHALISLLLVFSFANIAAAQTDGGFDLNPGERSVTDGNTFNTTASPVDAAVAAAKADPTNAAQIAADAAAANPDQAVAIALAVAKAFPGQRAKIAAAVAKVTPGQEEEIAQTIIDDAYNSDPEFSGEGAYLIWFPIFGTDYPGNDPSQHSQDVS